MILLLSVQRLAGQDNPGFAKDVLPILAASCFQCHGPDSANRKGDLRLDNIESVIDRAKRPTVINPNHPELSELVERLESDDSDFRMPPPEHGEKLDQSQITTLKTWILNGAKTKKHWAFVRPSRPTLPKIEDNGWARNPIDLFVLERMKDKGYRPNPPADRITLLKRLSLDLTGMIPSPIWVKAVSENPNVKWQHVIDRFMNSPDFGETKALSWLDTARFADTTGHAADKPRTMWPYRDWVINAFNENMSFDQFTIEQLAGDMLPNSTISQKVAIGFHRNSIQALGNNPKKEEFRIKGIVDRLDTTGKAWLGLTLSCAECHDHKYDPVSQQEYYELFAIFNNIPHEGERFDVHGPRIQMLSLATQNKVNHLLNRIRILSKNQNAGNSNTRFNRESVQRAVSQLGKTYLTLRNLQQPTISIHSLAARVDVDGTNIRIKRDFLSDRSKNKLSKDSPQKFYSSIQFGGESPFVLDSSHWTPVRHDFSISTWIKTTQSVGDLISSYDWRSGKRSFVFGLGSEGEPKSKPGHLFLWVSERNDPFSGVVAESSFPINDGKWHHVALVFKAGKSVRLFVDGAEDKKLSIAGKIPMSIADSKLPIVIGGGFSGNSVPGKFLFTGNLASFSLFDRALTRVQLGAFTESERQLIAAQAELPIGNRSKAYFRLLEELTQSLLPPTTAIDRLKEQVKRLKQQKVTAQVMREMASPRDTYIHVRGNFENRGAKVQPRIPKILFGDESQTPKRTSRINRLTLARQIVSPNNPMAARVAVNRIWQHHFGDGLVQTSADFGIRGDLPSHPKLLDWLAVELMESGWDIKHIHRLVVDSATYRQSSTGRASQWKLDPNNRWLARGPRVRMKGEQIRDNVLKAAGLLVTEIGGPSVFPPQPEGVGQFRDDTAGKWLNDDGPKRYRKSMYTYWQRMSPYPSLMTFDAPSRERCVVQRSKTNTPLQALVLMNDPHIVEIAKAIGKRIESHSVDVGERIRFGFVSVLARYPTNAEMGVFRNYIEREIELSNASVWFQFAQVLTNLDEAVTKE